MYKPRMPNKYEADVLSKILGKVSFNCIYLGEGEFRNTLCRDGNVISFVIKDDHRPRNPKSHSIALMIEGMLLWKDPEHDSNLKILFTQDELDFITKFKLTT